MSHSPREHRGLLVPAFCPLCLLWVARESACIPVVLAVSTPSPGLRGGDGPQREGCQAITCQAS
jgi:hypothetical protein